MSACHHATLQRCPPKLISAVWTVLRVLVSSALRMQLWSAWTTIRFKRFCAFFHDSWRRPLIVVDVAITLFILSDVNVAIILFIYTVYTPKFKVQQQLQQQFYFLSHIPCNYWQKKYFRKPLGIKYLFTARDCALNFVSSSHYPSHQH